MRSAHSGRDASPHTRANVAYERLILFFRGETDNAIVQFLRYTIVGGCVFAVDFSCLYVLTRYCHVYYMISAAFGFAIGVVLNYALSILWVFKKRRIRNWLSEFAIFSLIGLGGLLLNEVFIWYFTAIILFHYLIAKVLSTFFIYTYNFVVRKLMLFS